jgi:hypothetical protein
MPGVKITTSTLSGPRNVIGAPTSRAFIAGITERGTLTPRSVRSIVEYQAEFGTNQTYSAAMFRAAQTFFEEGGSELIVCRAVGTTPTVATITLVDRTAVTPLPTLRLDAANAGAWGAGVTVQITAGAVANSVTLQGFLGGVRVVNVKDKTSVADIVTALSADPYLRGTDLAPVSVYPTRLPAISGPSPLVGGADDRATVTIAKVVAALDLSNGLGSGAVATPGYNATVAGALLIAHSKAYRRVAILAGDTGSLASDLTTMAAANTTDGEYAGVFGPWVTVPEGTGTATSSPEGYILGARARAMNAEGFWQAPAGSRSAARFVLGPTAAYDATTIDSLADGHVSGITRIAGDTVLYGWRSLSTNTDQWALLNARDAANTLTSMMEAVLQPFVFETIDGTGQLVSRVKGALVGMLQPIQDAGGLSAKYDANNNEINQAYSVNVAVLNETTLSATAAVRFSGVAETIQVSLIKAAYNATI